MSCSSIPSSRHERICGSSPPCRAPRTRLRAQTTALRVARLESRADDPISSYSRGMRQRLALERALIHGPRLVLLDEPFTGLDRASADLLTDRLRSLASQGCLVLLATHDFALADGVVDRVAVMRDGRVAATAAAGEWREAYRNAIGREL